MKKISEIYESYINGNINWVRSEVKKLSKGGRKELYYYVCEMNGGTNETRDVETQKNDDADFFFNLI